MLRASDACASCAYLYPLRRGIIESKPVNLDSGNTVFMLPSTVLIETDDRLTRSRPNRVKLNTASFVIWAGGRESFALRTRVPAQVDVT